MRYLGSTFSPMMLGENVEARVVEINIGDIPPVNELESCVSHENTARLLSSLLGETVEFRRVNVVLTHGDYMYVVIPAVRFDQAREYTTEEIRNAEWKAFLVEVI